MSSLESLDIALFRFINGNCANSFLDSVMPLFAGNAWFYPMLAIAGIAAIWRGGARGRVCILMLAIVIPIGDGWITNTVKETIERPRPCLTLSNVNLPIVKSLALPESDEFRRGCSRSGSFPSGHTTNWFAATMVAAMFFRRTLRFMLPLACIVGFSRIYNGVHYPSDVLGGALIGAGYGAAIVLAVEALWRMAGRALVPIWWQQLPSLLRPETYPVPQLPISWRETLAGQWLRLGYLLTAAVFIARLIFLGSGRIELSEDEAYQWLWSKHLALSYFSKPPLIAYAQWLGTKLFGDTELGVRFFSPVCAAVGSLVLLRFFARHVSARAGFWLVALVNITPLLAIGSTTFTIDSLLVLFWTLVMAAGWRAVQADGRTRDWLIVGVWMGLAFLSKYTALLQWLCWALFFVLWKPARIHLKRSGPYLALAVNLLCTIPVMVWNAQHQWTSAAHVANDAKLGEASFQIGNVLEFVGGTAGLLHPILFVAAAWAATRFWKTSHQQPLARFFFAMGAPVFLLYLLYTFHSSVQINWIAASIIPLFCLAALFWDERAPEISPKLLRGWLAVTVGVGAFAVVLLHQPDRLLLHTNNLLAELRLGPLPDRADPLRRVRGWKSTARIVTRERDKLEAQGTPVIIIGGHYGITSLLSFYIPEARRTVTGTPLVYYRALRRPRNQFYYWPTYRELRPRDNALYVQEKTRPEPAPPDIYRAFAKVTEIGHFPVKERGRVLRYIQLFACTEPQ